MTTVRPSLLAGVIDWSLDNRLLVCVLALVLAVAGAWSIRTSPLDAIPDLSDVQVIVHADWPGRDPQTIEDHVTAPVSSALLNVAQVRDVRGLSFFGTSFVYVIFDDGTDPYWARSRVLESLATVGRRLPEGVTPSLGPDASGMGWVFLYTLEDESGHLDLGQLRALQDGYVRDQLLSVPGVAEVASLGGAVRQLQVTVHPNALRSHGLTLAGLIAAIRRSNNDVGGRVVEMAETEFMVRGRATLHGVRDLEAIPVGMGAHGTPIRLRDVARVALGPDIERGIADKDGRGEVVAGIVTMRYGGNALDVIQGTKARIREIAPGLPEGVVIRPAYDRSGLIGRAVSTLSTQLIEEMLIVAAACVLFLWHARSALVSSIVLPLGILVSFIVMRALGINADIMSLGGIAIAIGAMVDASVVMVENLHKHKEASPDTDHWSLVRRAAVEVGPALFFSLLVITVSFLPVFALEDVSGRLFKPLAFTKTFAMASAAVLTLVLMPVLMGLFVRGRLHREADNPVSRVMIAVYRPMLGFALRHRATSIVGAVVVLALTVAPLARLGSEWMPPIREGDALAMPTTLPGISSTEARRTLQIQDRLLAGFPEVAVVLGKIGRADTALDPAPLNMVETHITLRPEEQWPRRRLDPAWVGRAATALLRDARSAGWIDDHGDDPAETARQTALMTTAAVERWLRDAFDRGRTHAAIVDRLPARLVRQMADDLEGYVTARHGDGTVAPDRRGEVVSRHERRQSGDEIPLRRTTFAELTREEMHEEVRVPGMPNWWLMPIETRIGMLTTGMKGVVGIKVRGRDLADLEHTATQLERLLADVPGTLSVVADRALGGRFLDIDIDRERCARAGLSSGAVQDVIESAIGGRTITVAIEGRTRIPVSVRYPPELRDDPERLGRVLVATPAGDHIPLVQLATLRRTSGPPVIKSENGLLLTNVPIELEVGVDVGSYVATAQRALDAAIDSGNLDIPTGTYLSWSGQYRLLEQVRSRLWLIVPLTLVIIMVLIYCNTRNLTETLISMVTLPFALIGGVWLLFALDYDLSVAVAVGFIALAGLAAETAILMHVYLDIAYKKRAPDGGVLRGAALIDAVMEGAVLRVRPKMMTVVTTMLALAPIMWATGAGSGPMKRMAAPMIGGLLTSTLHTLVLIPVYYAMFQEYRARRQA